MIRLDDGIVKFEAARRPGEFFMVEEDGSYSLSRGPDPPRVTFRLMDKVYPKKQAVDSHARPKSPEAAQNHVFRPCNPSLAHAGR